MFQVRFHGRGGQGVVTAADLLAFAAFDSGHYAQAFPNFGSERMGAPVVSYCRIDERPIRNREPVIEPDALVIQDSTLLRQIDLFSGFKPDGFVVINTTKSLDDLGISEFAAEHDSGRMVTVPASDVALRHVGKPMPNAALLGGLAALTGIVDPDAIEKAIHRRFPAAIATHNFAAAMEVFNLVSASVSSKASNHAPTNGRDPVDA